MRSVGIMRSTARISAGGVCRPRAASTCRSGSKIEQQIDRHLRIAADMTAVGEDLPVQLHGEGARNLWRDLSPGVGADREFRERNGAEQTVGALGPPRGERAPQNARALRQRLHEGVVEFRLGAVEQRRRLRKERQHAPRHDGRLHRRIIGAELLQREKIGDERARLRLRRFSEARKCRSQEKPVSARRQAGDGGVSRNGDAPWLCMVLPAKEK